MRRRNFLAGLSGLGGLGYLIDGCGDKKNQDTSDITGLFNKKTFSDDHKIGYDDNNNYYPGNMFGIQQDVAIRIPIGKTYKDSTQLVFSQVKGFKCPTYDGRKLDTYYVKKAIEK